MKTFNELFKNENPETENERHSLDVLKHYNDERYGFNPSKTFLRMNGDDCCDRIYFNNLHKEIRIIQSGGGL